MHLQHILAETPSGARIIANENWTANNPPINIKKNKSRQR